MVDYELSALMMCRTFGWTLDYVLGLPLDVFLAITGRMQEVHSTFIMRENYLAMLSMLSRDVADYLLKTAREVVKSGYDYDYTDEDLQRAISKAKQVVDMVEKGEL